MTARFDTVAVVGFDADDTLWHCEPYFRAAEAEFAALFADCGTPEECVASFHRRMIANLPEWGYGVKSSILAMLQTGLALTGETLTAAQTAEILAIGKRLKARPATPFAAAEPTLRSLAARGYRLWLITKGDLLDQELKIAASGLAGFFEHIEIVSEKQKAVYQRLLERRQVAPAEFLMIGNSLRSDILPVLELGGHGGYIPSAHTWFFEHDDARDRPRLTTLAHLGELPLLLPENAPQPKD